MGNIVGGIIVVVLVLLALRMLFRESRQAVADTKDLVRNPTRVKWVGAMWSILAIVAMLYALATSQSAGTTVLILLAYLGALFDLGWAYKRNGGRLTAGDVVMNMVFAASCIPVGLYLLGHVSGWWGLLGFAGFVASFIFGALFEMREKENE